MNWTDVSIEIFYSSRGQIFISTEAVLFYLQLYNWKMIRCDNPSQNFKYQYGKSTYSVRWKETRCCFQWEQVIVCVCLSLHEFLYRIFFEGKTI